jgi:hypothetical protein
MYKKGIIQLFRYYMTILTNRAGTWTWTRADISRLMAADMRVLRRTEGKIKRDRIKSKRPDRIYR